MITCEVAGQCVMKPSPISETAPDSGMMPLRATFLAQGVSGGTNFEYKEVPTLFNPAACLTVVLLLVCAAARADPPVVTVTQNAASIGRYDIYELTMTNTASSYTNPWEDPLITAVFTAPSGTNYTVGGFYFNPSTWKLRFAPKEIGNWTWTLAFADAGGTYNTSGGFAATNSTNTGFLRRNPTCTYGLVTENGGTPFYARGFEIPVPNNPAQNFTNLSQHDFSTDAYGVPVTIAQFLAVSGRAGFNMMRDMNEQDAFKNITGFNVNNTGKNTYDLNQGMLGDQLMAALHQAGWKCLMTIWATAKGGYAVTNPPGSDTNSQATLRLHQYIINRFGAYVDVWELLNEKSSVPQAYTDAVTTYVRANDPYQHLITINYSQSYSSEFDMETFHAYYSNNDDSIAAAVVSSINGLKSDLQPIISTELGSSAPYGAYDPMRFRIINWAAFFNQGMLLWTDMGAKSAYTSSGLANQYIGSEERASMKILTDYLAGFDPAATTFVPALLPAKLRGYGLASSQDLGLYVFNTNSVNEVVTNGMVTLNVPTNNMQGLWINPASGALIQAVAVNAGSHTLAIPSFETDIALRLRPAVTQPVLQFSSSSYSTNADQGSVTLTVYRMGGLGNAVTVNYATSDGLAQAGVNYTAVTGNLSWGASDDSPRTITVPLLFNGTLNADLDFLVSLSNPTGGAILGTANPALVTLVNPVVNDAVFSAPSYSVAAGAGTAVFTVNRLGNGNGPLTVYYSTRAGTAVAGTDYVAIAQPGTPGKTPQALTWADGDLAAKTFPVTILNSNPSSNVTFTVALDDGVWPSPLSAPFYRRSLVNILSANTAASAGILAFDGYSNMTAFGYGYPAAVYTVYGTNSSASIPVSRTGGSSGAVSVTYSFGGGTGIPGTDFSGNGGTLSWADGDSADKIITVPIINSTNETGTVPTWLQFGVPTGGTVVGSPYTALLNIVYSNAVLNPGIVIAPVNQSTTTGQAATFSVVVSGSGPVSYQWLKNGTNIVGATNATYTTPTLVAADNGATFSVVVGNSAGSVTSSVATLTLTDVPIPPAITSQPSSQMVNVGQPAAFTVAATGTAPLYYQWQKNGTNIAGATSATDTIAAAQLTDAGSYAVIVTNSVGSVTSSAATLTVNDPTWSGWLHLKAITINHGQVAAAQTNFPVLIVINDDHDLAAHARADGADLVFTDTIGNLLAFEIETNYLATGGATGGTKARVWVNIPSLSNSADTVINLRYGNPLCSTSRQNAPQVWTNGFAGVWHLGESASPAYDSTANAASLAGNSGSTFGAAGEIGNAVSFDGSTGFLTTDTGAALVLAGSPGTISAWVYPTTLVGGARVCSIGTTGFAEGYQFAVSAGNTFRFGFSGDGFVSSTSTLSLNTWQQIVATWNGTNLQFYLQGAAAGTAAYAFYPQNNGTTFNIGKSVWTPSAWNGSLDEIRISSVVRSAGWVATEYNNQSNPSAFAGLGSEWSTPVVVTPPSPQTVDVGQGVSFSVAASGTSPLFYQWRLNGTNIVSATNATYNVASVSATNAGTYIVVISNVVSSITSIAVTLTVNVWPVITTISSLPAGTVGVGYSQTLIATNGTPPYTWIAIGGALPGGLTFDATGLLSGTPTATGTFSFIAQVTDSVSATTNGNFALTINPALALLSAVSRKTHGASGTFDLPLMLDPTSNATVEPRLGGPTTLIFNFNTNVAAAGGVLNAGSFTLTNVIYSAASISSSNLTLNLTNAVDQSLVTVVLSGITDSAGNPLAGTNAVRIRSLYGDVNQSGTVNAVDLQQVKNNLLATLTPANFLCDVNCSGTINAVDLQQIKNNLLHTASLSSGGSGLVVSGLSMTPALAAATLGEALGATNLTWSTDGDAVWTPTITKDGSSAAWSGHIGNLNVSWVETTVMGPGTLSFQWMVSSELNGDFLTFSIDGVDQPGPISGEAGWQTLTYLIPAGPHRLTWTYAKNAANASGLDAGWLRRVVYQ